MDGDDVDARLAPFEWLNDSLPLTLKLHITLVHLADRKPSRLNLADWDKMTMSELSNAGPDSGNRQALKEPEFTRSLVIAHAEKLTDAYVSNQKKMTRQCREALARLDAVLRGQLANNTPSLSNISTVLDLMGRALGQIAPEQVNLHQAPLPISQQEEVLMPVTEGELDDSSNLSLEKPLTQTLEKPITLGWQTREQAYLALESIADFLHKAEPHSPTPYLIKRAVNWGRMPLPELMAEVIREEGDLNKLINLMGLSKSND
jgi:type VI secretion system protein ImpA